MPWQKFIIKSSYNNNKYKDKERYKYSKFYILKCGDIYTYIDIININQNIVYEDILTTYTKIITNITIEQQYITKEDS